MSTSKYHRCCLDVHVNSLRSASYLCMSTLEYVTVVVWYRPTAYLRCNLGKKKWKKNCINFSCLLDCLL